MNINIDRHKMLVDRNLINPVKEAFQYVQSNNTAVNRIKFIDQFRTLPKTDVLENLSFLYELNTNSSLNLLNTVLRANVLTESQLNDYKSSIQSYMKNHQDSENNKLEESIQIIDNNLRKLDDIELVKENIKYAIAADHFHDMCILESYLSDELEIIMYNINHSPETISYLAEFITKIKMSKTSEYFSSFPTLLDQSTKMLFALNVNVTGDVLDLVTSIPTVIAEQLVDHGASRSQIKQFIRLYDKQTGIMVKEMKHDVNTKYTLYMTYMRKINLAKELLSRHISDVTNESNTKVYEDLAGMQPDIVLYDESITEDVAAEIEDSMVDLFYDVESDQDTTKTIENFCLLCNHYDRLYESKSSATGGTLQKISNHVGNATRKISNNAVSASKKMDRAKTTIARSIEPLVNLLNNSLNKIKAMDKKERTDRIITGELKFKLLNIIKKAVIGIVTYKATKFVVGAALHPLVGAAAGAIGILAAIAINKSIDKKYRRGIINDLETELKMVDEKIEDSKSDGDRSKKYELMRIRAKLVKDIERIKYNL